MLHPAGRYASGVLCIMFLHGALCFHIQHCTPLLKINDALEYPSLLGCDAVPLRIYRRFKDRCAFKTAKATRPPTRCHIPNEQNLRQYRLQNLVSRKLCSYITSRVHGIGEQPFLHAFAWNNSVPIDGFPPNQILQDFLNICPENRTIVKNRQE